ncbi:MAG: caspase family protein [Candidatus Anammoxibacter sp.]
MKTLLIKPLVVLLFFLCIAMQLLGQQQRKRLALVIGNAAYQHGGALKNPVNDANLMARTLEDLGFDVIKETDAGLKGHAKRI